MPSIVDMVDILERLESKALHVEPARCVKVRNRNASCMRCAKACTSGAISIEANVLQIDANKCTGCGTCSSVCPTSAILCDAPSDAQLADDIQRSVSALDGEAVVICGRVAARKTVDVNKVAEVLCLGRMDTGSLVGAVSLGAHCVTLVDGGCATCKFRNAVPFIDTALQEANELFSAWGTAARIVRTSTIPSDILAQDRNQATGGVSRRDFFTGVRSQAKTIATETASYTIEKELGVKRESVSLREMLKVGEDGCLPHSTIPRHDDLLENLFAMGDPDPDAMLHVRQWGDVSIDAKECDNCGLCVTFCATGALSKVMQEPKKKPGRSTKRSAEIDHIEFRLCDCVGCGLCVDVCTARAITLSHEIEASRIFELEPRETYGEKKRRSLVGDRSR